MINFAPSDKPRMDAGNLRGKSARDLVLRYLFARDGFILFSRRSTQRALVRRGLIGKDFELTPLGISVARGILRIAGYMPSRELSAPEVCPGSEIPVRYWREDGFIGVARCG